jgi:hypothetical protein
MFSSYEVLSENNIVQQQVLRNEETEVEQAQENWVTEPIWTLSRYMN